MVSGDGSRERYTNVTVLMIHWVGSLDEDLKACTEVTPLANILRDDCGYKTKIVQLDNKDTPAQLQLDRTIADFVREYDGPCRTHLLIIYYTGHGYVWRAQPNELIVSGTATAKSSSTGGTFPPNANWTQAEQPLDGASADTLVILDCCFAGNAMRARLPSRGARSYELMVATGKNMPATQPGPRSYTHALINALRALLQGDGNFTTADLAQDIHELRDHDRASQLYNRLAGRIRHICFAPLERRNLPASSEAVREGGSSLDVRPDSRDQDSLRNGEAERATSEARKSPSYTRLGGSGNQ
ncbi:Phosphatidylinositol-4-phosphate 5-kinase [Friedmanniomyces endolithicus]|nr:Phosphatidylinositol-4-phosphate 5-kinase [Friedmanniomyces endolithicus]